MNTHISSIEQQIDPQLESREDARDEIDETIIKLDNYEIDLNNLISQFNPLSCPSKATSLNEIGIELSYAISSRQAKLDEKSGNETVITRLEDALEGMAKAEITVNESALAEIIRTVQPHISNPLEGENFLNKQKTDLVTLESRIDDKLTRFNGLLANCLAGL